MRQLNLALLIVTMSTLASSLSAVEIIGHRGASADAPENTLGSFKLGYEQEADAVELDIHLSKDGRLVVLHDFDTARVAGVHAKVEDRTLEELRKLEIGQWGRWKGSAFSEKMPTLEEVLALVPAGRRLFVEIKCQGSASATARCRDQLVPELVRVLRQHPVQARQVALITFSFEVAKAAKEKLPHVPVCWLFEWKIKPGDGDSPRVDDLVAKVKAAHLDGLDLHYNSPIDGEFVHKMRAAHLRLYVWTVDDPAAARRLAAAGVDGITTNRPRWLRQQLMHPASPEPKRN